MTGLATPDITALIQRPGRGPPPTASITSPSGVPIRTSPTPWTRVEPVTVHTKVPGARLVPTVLNQAGPRATMRGMLAMVSTLLTSAGATWGAAAEAEVVVWMSDVP